MAGYTGGTDGESIEALVNETFGMSTVAYLTPCGPALLPSLEELQAQYDGSGTYTALEGVLTRQFEAGGPGAVRQSAISGKGRTWFCPGRRRMRRVPFHWTGSRDIIPWYIHCARPKTGDGQPISAPGPVSGEGGCRGVASGERKESR